MTAKATPDDGRAFDDRVLDEGRVAGVYIAHHRWLDAEFGPGHLHKVGHTGDLRARLVDDAYATCFPEGWRYVATFECETKDAAHGLETAVLHCARARRLDGRELVRMTAAELDRLVAAVAATLGVACRRREMPVYGARARPSAGLLSRAAAALASALSGWDRSRALIEHHSVPPAATDDDYIDEILSWDVAERLTIAAPATATSATATSATSATSATATPKKTEAPAGAKAGADATDADDVTADDLDDSEFVMLSSRNPYDVPARALEMREYQREAVAACVDELARKAAAVLQMACRCGKTPVAFGIIRDFLALPSAARLRLEPAQNTGKVCFLVPGLSLLRQTAQKLASYGYSAPTLLVGSDAQPVPTAGGELSMTTDPAAIRAFLEGGGPRLVISTYQSSPLVPTGAFALTVFDECHRVCGGRAPRPFNHFALAPRVGARLFMTATPAHEGAPATAITMSDRETFGGVAYRYHLRRGIAAGYVNDFRLEFVIAAAPADDSAAPAVAAAGPALDTLAAQVAAASDKADKLLVFCRDIRHAQELCDAFVRALDRRGPAAGQPPRPRAIVAHSRMGAGGAAAALRAFSTPGLRAVLFNCRLFQEGVEIPELNAVFFAAPRHSPRDIIQSVCRPLNRTPGKPPSTIYLPVAHDPALAFDDPANLRRFASIVPFVDALLDEDPGLYEHLLDPTGRPYPLGVLGAHTYGRPLDAKAQEALLGAVRRTVRFGVGVRTDAERLLRVENVPWDRAFAEIKRVVEVCGRYPKTTDAWVVGEARVCLHRFYKYAQEQYTLSRAGKPSKLEPHQVRDLASLRDWDKFGVEGPYPWRFCMNFLERWLADHGGVPPMVEINKGGYIGLDASPMERLSGALTCINQGDGKRRKNGAGGFTVSPEKQRDLDRICAKYGLRWRKERDAAGDLVEGGPLTFIQESYGRFKAYYKEHGKEAPYIVEFFENYPDKHRIQERLDVHRAGLAAPRYRSPNKAANTTTTRRGRWGRAPASAPTTPVARSKTNNDDDDGDADD